MVLGEYLATTIDGRSKILHNFTFSDLKWGNQRFLRCEKINSDAVDQQRLRSTSEFEDVVTPLGVCGGSDQRLEMERLRSMEKEGIEEFREKMTSDLSTVANKEYQKDEVSPPETVKARPWNLRKRRAVSKAPIPEIEEKRVMNCSKFLSTLSKKEIEDDYMKMIGHRPPRRPKKRLRTVQKQVDLLKPALYFSEITEDLY